MIKRGTGRIEYWRRQKVQKDAIGVFNDLTEIENREESRYVMSHNENFKIQSYAQSIKGFITCSMHDHYE